MNNKSNDKNLNRGISSRLRAERKRLKLNQQQVADLMGTVMSSYFKYEKGERSLPADKLAALEPHSFDVSYILTGQQLNNELSNQLAEQLNSLSAEQVSAITTIVKGLIAGNKSMLNEQ